MASPDDATSEDASKIDMEKTATILAVIKNRLMENDLVEQALLLSLRSQNGHRQYQADLQTAGKTYMRFRL